MASCGKWEETLLSKILLYAVRFLAQTMKNSSRPKVLGKCCPRALARGTSATATPPIIPVLYVKVVTSHQLEDLITNRNVFVLSLTLPVI